MEVDKDLLTDLLSRIEELEERLDEVEQRLYEELSNGGSGMSTFTPEEED